MSKKTWIAVLGGAAAALALAPAAQAGASVHLNIGVPLVGGAYYAPPAYYAPAPVYYGPPAYVAPRTWYYVGGHRYYGHRSLRHDRDRDGVPNRWDRDRDGDGVPNRWDRRPGNGHRR